MSSKERQRKRNNAARASAEPAGIPEQFIKSLETIAGLDISAFRTAMEEAPATGVRLNSRKPLPGGASHFGGSTPVEWCETGFYLNERPQFTTDPLLHAGCYYVQDPSSMIHRRIVEEILALPGMRCERVLDLCAAPGGKTTAMIDALPESCCMVANEINGKRRQLLEENIQKWGWPNVAVAGSDTADFARCGALFDIVAVDAPCSGEGMMRKEPMARAQWSRQLVEECAALQREILDNAVEALRPGGVLIYSTCTFNLDEDEQNARYLIEHHGLEPLRLDLPGLPAATLFANESTGVAGSRRFMPHITRGEGLFVSVLRKPGDASPSLPSAKGSKSKGTDFGEVKEWLQGDFVLREEGDSIMASGKELTALCDAIRDKVRLTRCGVEAAIRKGRDLQPAQALALSTALRRGAFPEVETDLSAALDYLRRQALTLPADTPKGYVLLTYNSVPVGFVKNLGNRANNLFPAMWRIRNL